MRTRLPKSKRTLFPAGHVESICVVNKPGLNLFGHRVNTTKGALDRMLMKGDSIEVISEKLDISEDAVNKHVGELKRRNVPIDRTKDGMVKIRI